jgi:ribosomal protein S18 acetylase RimI-like enzyme
VIEQAHGLSSAQLDAMAALERRVVAADGGRLKLEWPVLRGRNGREAEDLLCWEGSLLVGFLGLYGFAPPAIEITGMVDPRFRRRRIFSAMLDQALPLCRERGFKRALLVVPRNSAPGRTLALLRGGTLEHSEHALVLDRVPPNMPSDPRIVVRQGTISDAPELQRVLAEAFGAPGPDVQERLIDPSAEIKAIVRDGVLVGTLRVELEPPTARIYGFAVDPAWQGQGIGREALRRVCRGLYEQGFERIGLEVDVDNDRALALYTSVGFAPVATEDYFALEVVTNPPFTESSRNWGAVPESSGM